MPGATNEKWEDVVSLRSFRDTDRKFIENHWCLGVYHGSNYFKKVPQGKFELFYRQLIRKLMTDPGRWIVVACITEQPDAIVGFSVGKDSQESPETLHYVYVKTSWRGLGIGSALVPQDIIQYTQFTKIGDAIAKNHPNIIFNPFNL